MLGPQSTGLGQALIRDTGAKGERVMLWSAALVERIGLTGHGIGAFLFREKKLRHQRGGLGGYSSEEEKDGISDCKITYATHQSRIVKNYA
jgi:hypothetical protein